MPSIDVVFFDVLGTVVDWRGSISAEVEKFLQTCHMSNVDARALADAWVGRYDNAAEKVRNGSRPYVTLDVLNRETLEACIAEFGLEPSRIPNRELEELNRAWHRLKPWPDAVEGITKLKERFVVAPLSDGHTRMLVDLAKFAELPWDTVLGADVFKAYKPTPEVYIGACNLLDVAPEKAILVAAHDYDLAGARQCGLKTALVHRRNAADPSKASNIPSSGSWDFSANDLGELAKVLGQNLLR